MDHLLELAAVLLPSVLEAKQADPPRPTLLDLLEKINQRRANTAAPLREGSTDDPKTKVPDQPELAKSAPRVFKIEVLADLLARNPSYIPAALKEAGKATFYPTFLDYLLQNVEEIAVNPRANLWKIFTATEHLDLRNDRQQRVCGILLKTDSWAAAMAAKPSSDDATDEGAAPATGGTTVSMLGSGEIGARAAKRYQRARHYVREKAGFVCGDPLAVRDLLRSGGERAEQFLRALADELLVKPPLVRELTEVTAIAVPFNIALNAELDEIRDSRARRGVAPSGDSAEHSARRSAEMNLLGVALSGGGVRSATFNLGVLQGLAHFGLLSRVDYLSTVSGGGYIGAWLASWSKRVGGGEDDGILGVETRLQTEPLSEPDALPVRAVRFLREYSNYLTPEAGVFTADTWTMIAIWLRNTMLNQAVLVLTLCSFLGVPWMLWVIQSRLTWATSSIDIPAALRTDCSPSLFATSPVMMIASAAALLYASAIAAQQLRRFALARVGPVDERTDTLAQSGVLIFIVAPAMVSAALIAAALYNALGCAGSRTFMVPAFRELTALFALAMSVVAVGGHYLSAFIAERVAAKPGPWSQARLYVVGVIIVGAAVVLGSLTGAAVLVGVARGLAWWLAQRPDTPAMLSFYVVAFGVPVAVTAFSLIIVVNIGILGRDLSDEQREWWSRLGAWLNIVALGWLVLCSLSLFSPRLVAVAKDTTWRYVISSGGVLWALWTGAGVLMAKRETLATLRTSTRLRRWTLAAAPYAFIVGLLILLSAATFSLLSPDSGGAVRPRDVLGAHFLGGTRERWMLGLPWLLLSLALVLSWRVDVNEFSMHHFYRNRLVRCYLGASRDQDAERPERMPDPFTGFDPGDDLKLAYLRTRPGGGDPDALAEKQRDNPQDVLAYAGPLPIVNTALNLVKGDDLAWQERRAQSFVFTPFYSGYDYRHRGDIDRRHAPYGFRQTPLYGYPPYGVGMGTAMAISGAAASPNMGYQSSPPAAFLMTMFNARLGWWMGNPRDKNNWLRSGPRRGLLYLLNELFGMTNDRTQFVNLSDGGHFENLGIYELVRRRCRYIIACDAEQDASMTFGGLGNAIRKCRTDLGTEISVSATRIRPIGGALSPLHGVLGDITYPDGEKGTLLYLKASVTGDEPADVLEYAARETAFPHHATLPDQFFDESQFESYRKLGFHITYSAFDTPRRSAGVVRQPGSKSLATHPELAALFDHMRDYWRPQNPAASARRGDHTDQYDALLERVRHDPELAFADAAFFPSVPGEANRQQLFVGALMLDLMQRVYIDLDLDNDRDHPHNSGWITIFRRWKQQPAVMAAWEASAEDYGRPFRWFYQSL